MTDFFKKIFQLFKIKNLRRRVLIVLTLLVVFRITANIPLPGVDFGRLRSLFEANQFLGLINIFTGNTLSNFSIALLGLGPYITAIIILQLLTLIYPKLKALYYEEGEAGRAKFNQYARLLTIPLTLLQSFGFLRFLEFQGILQFFTFFDILRDVIIVTAGTMFLMWLGELITEQKLANGISLLIFSGIIARAPVIVQQAILNFSIDKIDSYIILILLSFFILAGIVVANEGERRIPLNFAKRVRGTKLYGGVSSYLPVKINQAGVIPIIFAISILLFPATIFQFLSAAGVDFFKTLAQDFNNFYQRRLIFGSLYFILVFAFTYFYTAITFEPNELALNLQKSGAFIPGIRPGKETANYLSSVVNKINLGGGIFLGLIAILPYIVEGITRLNFAGIGGTSVLIVVSVGLETLRQIDAELSLHSY